MIISLLCLQHYVTSGIKLTRTQININRTSSSDLSQIATVLHPKSREATLTHKLKDN